MNHETCPVRPGERDGDEFLARRFEAHRGHLRAVAHRVLGSAAEADDAVQEAWFRLSRSDTRQVDNLGGWLTTVVGRVCLDMLRTRRSRAEQPLDTVIPGASDASGASDPLGAGGPALAPLSFTAADPEQTALLADSVGVALLVVLETLTPAERLAFVLHDLFAVPYDDIAGIVGKSPAAARQLASRARRRVQGAGAQAPGADLVRQREVVDAFLAATREGDFDGLLKVLDPDVMVRADAGVRTGAAAVAAGATGFAHLASAARPALVDGRTGLAVLLDGRVERTLAFTLARDRIAVIDITTDPERLARTAVALL